jgi:hypothetical protein
MRETRPYGSVRGATREGRPYRDRVLASDLLQVQELCMLSTVLPCGLVAGKPLNSLAIVVENLFRSSNGRIVVDFRFARDSTRTPTVTRSSSMQWPHGRFQLSGKNQVRMFFVG